MTDEQLLTELKKKNLLSDVVIKTLQRDALLSGQPLEAIIYERKLIEDKELAQIKSEILNVPFYTFDPEKLSKELLTMLSEEMVRTYRVAPISKEGNILTVGMVNPDDSKAQDALKFLGRRNNVSLGIYLISYGNWQEALRKYSPYKTMIAEAIKSLGLSAGGGGRELVELEDAGKGSAEDAPIIRIVAETVREAVQAKASDIHIEPQEKYLRIRFRLDGDLHEAAELPLEVSQAVISRIKVISRLKIDENRVPQDGRFRARVFGREVDFRIATFPTPLGEKVAIRILDPMTGLRKLEELNLHPINLKKLLAGLDKPYGMLLVTGPTGSGKTTAIYGMLQRLNKEDVNIVSLEDPVEYSISGLNQSQVRPEIGYTFASGLRQILRQDPDVILVGEIRDGETAELAVHAALTGHIVLSTLHTNNAIGAIPRLADMGVDSFLLPSAVSLVTAQRLLGQMCSACKVLKDPSPQVAKIIEEELGMLPEEAREGFKAPYKVYEAKGCKECNEKGISGRLAIFEVFEMTARLADLIGGGKPTPSALEAEAKKQGMLTMRQDGIIKSLKGLFSIEEVLRETKAAIE